MKKEEASKKIHQGLESLSQAIEAGRSEELTRFLNYTAKFHRYSFTNIMLILLQREEASHVAGFTTWKNLGRRVKKGEKGIGIIAPMRYRKKDTDSDEDETSIRGWKMVHVFDVSQTEGDEMPEFPAVGGEPGERIEAAIAKHGIELVEGPLPPGTLRLSHCGKITVREGLPRAERFSVLVHEFAHELMHKREDRREIAAKVKECEAEAVSSEDVSQFQSYERAIAWVIQSEVGKRDNHDLWRKRSMSWERKVSRDVLKTATRNTLGAISTLFLIKGGAAQDMFQHAVALGDSIVVPKKSPSVEPVDEDEKVMIEEVAAKADDFIEDRIANLDWEQMQELVSEILVVSGIRWHHCSAKRHEREND